MGSHARPGIGRALSQYDAAKEFTGVNGPAGKGGNMSGSGPVVAGGILLVPSGYSDLFGGTAPRGI